MCTAEGSDGNLFVESVTTALEFVFARGFLMINVLKMYQN